MKFLIILTVSTVLYVLLFLLLNRGAFQKYIPRFLGVSNLIFGALALLNGCLFTIDLYIFEPYGLLITVQVFFVSSILLSLYARSPSIRYFGVSMTIVYVVGFCFGVLNFTLPIERLKPINQTYSLAKKGSVMGQESIILIKKKAFGLEKQTRLGTMGCAYVVKEIEVLEFIPTDSLVCQVISRRNPEDTCVTTFYLSASGDSLKEPRIHPESLTEAYGQ